MKNISFKNWLNEAFTGQSIDRGYVKELCQKIIDHQDVEVNLNVLADIYDSAYNHDKATVLRGCMHYIEPEPWGSLGNSLNSMLKAGAEHGWLKFEYSRFMLNKEWDNTVACELYGTLPLSEVFDGSVYYNGNEVSKQGAEASVLTYVSPTVLRGCKESQMSVKQYSETFDDVVPASNAAVHVKLTTNTTSYRLNWKYSGLSQSNESLTSKIGMYQHDADEYSLRKQNIKIYSAGFDGEVKDEFADFIRNELASKENVGKLKFIEDFESIYLRNWALTMVAQK